MRHLIIVAVGLSLAVGRATGAPGPKADDAPLHFPTAAGDKATYQTTIGDRPYEHTERVIEAVRGRDGFRVTTELAAAGRPAVRNQWDVSPKGLNQVQSAGRDVDPPIPELRLPAKAGDTWTWEAPGVGDGPARKITFKVVAEEEIEVPAGKFKTLKVERVMTAGTFTHKTETWFAPKVGLVKRVSNAGGSSEAVQELKSFVPASK
jgi:hypothetical protein